jgi:hypothetical protein
MESRIKQNILTIITGFAILLTIAGYIAFLSWTRQSVSGVALMLFGIIFAVFFFPLLKKDIPPVAKRQVFAIVGILLFVFWLILLAGFFSAMTNNMPGYYEYSISIQGLDNYHSGPITDIIVPLPMRDGKDVFSDDDLQYKKFGNWTSLLVMTESGKMLAFQTTQRNLTNIDAKFFKRYSGGVEIRNITNESLAPVLPGNSSGYPSENNNKRVFSSKIYLSNATLPLDTNGPPVTFNLELTMNGGMVHSIAQGSYRVSILETIPSNIRGWIPVSARIKTL